MRMLVVFMLGLATVVTAFVFSPELRQRTEAVLFGAGQPAQTPSDEPARPETALTDTGGVVDVLSQAGQDAVTALADVAAGTHIGPTQQTEPDELQGTVASDASAAPGQDARPGGEQPDAAPEKPIVLPRFLRAARFGTSPDQIKRLYPVAWSKQDGRELALSHYPVRDKSQMAQFHFRGDSLYMIRIVLKPDGAQTLQQLYDLHQQSFASQYASVKEVRRTRWSDGTVIVMIGQDKKLNSVLITYSAPSYKR